MAETSLMDLFESPEEFTDRQIEDPETSLMDLFESPEEIAGLFLISCVLGFLF
jgi:hypothetical protein